MSSLVQDLLDNYSLQDIKTMAKFHRINVHQPTADLVKAVAVANVYRIRVAMMKAGEKVLEDLPAYTFMNISEEGGLTKEDVTALSQVSKGVRSKITDPGIRPVITRLPGVSFDKLEKLLKNVIPTIDSIRSIYYELMLNNERSESYQKYLDQKHIKCDDDLKNILRQVLQQSGEIYVSLYCDENNIHHRYGMYSQEDLRKILEHGRELAVAKISELKETIADKKKLLEQIADKTGLSTKELIYLYQALRGFDYYDPFANAYYENDEKIVERAAKKLRKFFMKSLLKTIPDAKTVQIIVPDDARTLKTELDDNDTREMVWFDRDRGFYTFRTSAAAEDFVLKKQHELANYPKDTVNQTVIKILNTVRHGFLDES